MKSFLKGFLITGAVIFAGYMAYTWHNPEAIGIHPIPPNAVLIEGECITINWDATVEEWQLAFAKWQELKHLEGGK